MYFKKEFTLLQKTLLILVILILSSIAAFSQKITINERKISFEKAIQLISSKVGYGYMFDPKITLGTSIFNLKLKNVTVNQAIESILQYLPLSYRIEDEVIFIDPSDRVWTKATNPSAKEAAPVADANKLSGAILNEVNIVSTGYQRIPKERATGSFVLIDSVLFNRRNGRNVLDRLDGVASGLTFNKNTIGNTPAISIRDRSTISANTNPLIILDNFPYDGDLTNINPQDVKSITILKDAASASIWGVRAGNGVIVITTKDGTFNQSPLINLNVNYTIGAKPDQYYKSQLTNKEFIDNEQLLFNKGKFEPNISNGYGSLSPAVEIMLLSRKNLITEARKSAMLDSLANHDNRADLDKYFYRKSVSQQYQLSAEGGGKHNKYYLSFGYDKDLANNVTNSADRITVNANNTLLLFKSKLELVTGIMLISNNNKMRGSGYQPLYPYENVADQAGNALALSRDLRLAYVDTAGAGRLLDWHYRPLDELREESHLWYSKITTYRVNMALNYKIINNLRFSVNYTYDKGTNENREITAQNSYYARNLINSFSQIDETSGNVKRPFPLGDIVNSTEGTYHAHYGRAQLNYQTQIASKNDINTIAGYEVKDYQSSDSYYTLYGYNEATATNLNATINPLQDLPKYYNGEITRIPLTIGNNGSVDRYLSYYANGSYAYDRRYILSGSVRRDESNLFGVSSNQKGVPLWSTGFAWNISQEKFYHFSALPYLKLRVTYGYNGNVDKSTSAYLTTQSVAGGNLWGQPILQIKNPPNPSLRWEKVKNINFGFDFGSSQNRITGSLEYWIKNGIDLIGFSPIAPQTGVSVFKGNSADMLSKGIDITFKVLNLNRTAIQWSTVYLFNYNTDKITSYKGKRGGNSTVVSGNYINPLEGFSYYSIFSYKWMGLDTAGNPQSILNGVTSKDYTNIRSSKNPAELVYSGKQTPTYFGSVRNTLSYKSWELSFNIIYKFKYNFRRTSLNNTLLYQGNGSVASYQQDDYNMRWKKRGDELTTNVPALIYPAKSIRDDIYTFSDILIEKADHIRLQDIRIDYQPVKNRIKNLPFPALDIYLYASNLGILWKATKKKIDPDYPYGIPAPGIISLGFKATF